MPLVTIPSWVFVLESMISSEIEHDSHNYFKLYRIRLVAKDFTKKMVLFKHSINLSLLRFTIKHFLIKCENDLNKAVKY